MESPNDIVEKNGQKLTRRVWALVDDACVAVDLDAAAVYVSQGGFKAGDGADASAGTHDIGDVFDISVRDIPDALQIPLVVALRRRNVCAYLRSPEFGWTKTGPHIHGVVRDSVNGLSRGALQQVGNYDDGLNALANGGRDPFPRPKQYPFTIARTTRVTRVPRTGVYTLKSEHSTRLAWKLCNPLKDNVRYVATERDSIGRVWLHLAAGGWMLAAATAYRP